MRKGLTIFCLFFIILVVLGEVCLPWIVSNMLKTQAEQRLATTDMEINLSSTPNFLMCLGRVDDLQAVAHRARVGKVGARELTLTGKKVHLDMQSLLNGETVRVSKAEELVLTGIIDEENLRDALSRSIDRIENVQVRIAPELVTVTAEAKIFGQKAEIELTGRVIEDLGALYFQMERLSLKNSRMGLAKLEGVFGDMFGNIELAGADKLPLGLKLMKAEQSDGVIILQAER